MTDYNTVGKTVLDYNENCQQIACLKKQLGDIGSHLELLGQQLQGQPSSVTVSSNSVNVSQMHPIVIQEVSTAIPNSELNPETLGAILVALQKAMAAHHKLDNTLRGMGLSESIREV